MLNLNRILGDESEVVRVMVTTEVTLRVGGESRKDRIDSVRELLEDHYDDIVESEFFSHGITGLTTEILAPGERSAMEVLEDVANVIHADDLPDFEKAEKIEEILRPYAKVPVAKHDAEEIEDILKGGIQ